MARLITNGTPGEVWTNAGPKVQYQLIVSWHNSCGLCAQYSNAVSSWWPIPFHRGCLCRQQPVWPGETSEPFEDFRELIRELDPVQQKRVVGVAAWKLVEDGVIEWDDVVTNNRVRSLREVVSRKKLSVATMTDAGVMKHVAERAHETVNTPAHVLAEAQRAEAIRRLKDLGVGSAEVRRKFGEAMAGRVRIDAGPSGPGAMPTVKPPPVAPLPPAVVAAALGVKLKPKPKPKPKPVPQPVRPANWKQLPSDLRRAVEIAEAEGIPVEPNGYERIARGDVTHHPVSVVNAIYSLADRTIYFNQRALHLWDNTAYSGEKQFAAGFKSSPSPDHTVRHEIGHALHHKGLADAEVYWNMDRDLPAALRETVGTQVSGYATTDRGEFVAEVYAGLRDGRTYSQEIMDYYDSLKGPRP